MKTADVAAIGDLRMSAKRLYECSREQLEIGIASASRALVNHTATPVNA